MTLQNLRDLSGSKKVLFEISVGVAVVFFVVPNDRWPALFQLLLVSIVCTLGIGAWFWTGIIFFLGSIVFETFLFVTSMGSPPKSIHSELQIYVVSARQAQISDEEIRQNLLRVGWKKAEVDATIRSVKR